MMETEADVMTRYEVYQHLNAEHAIACDSQAGNVVRRESWGRIDWLLDILIDLNAIEQLEAIDGDQ